MADFKRKIPNWNAEASSIINQTKMPNWNAEVSITEQTNRNSSVIIPSARISPFPGGARGGLSWDWPSWCDVKKAACITACGLLAPEAIPACIAVCDLIC